jgi:O-antigen/teichoic acid export membrane protein
VGGLLGWGNLVLGGVLSRITSILFFVKKIQFKESFLGFLKSVSVKKISNQFKENKDLIKYSVPSALLYKINSNLPIFYLANYLDSALVGFFVLTNRVILAPIFLLGTSVGDVFQNRIRKKIENKNELLKVLASVWLISLIVILPVSLCLFLFGSQMFGLLFGEKWQTSGYIASALAVSLSFKFMSSITNGTFTMLKLESVGFYCSVFELPSKILIFVFFDQKNELINSFWAIAIYDAIQIVCVNILMLFKINKKRV